MVEQYQSNKSALQTKQRGKNKQLAINMVATVVTFVVNFGINFFLSPFIVRSLGTAAYGFVGLSNNIIGYTSLITIALNSLAGRFITIKYTQGKYDEANRYFSSVFYSNLVLSAIIVLTMGACTIYLEYIFDIPEELVFDVKLLFCLLVINTVIGLLANIYSIAVFVKNRLELSSIRGIIGNLIRAVVLCVMFGLLTPHLWYLGLAGILVSIYSAYTNYKFTNILTPEFKISRANWDFSKVKELIISGSWNVISKLNDMLSQGLDLVVANLLIGPVAMGTFSISKIIPTFVLQFFSQMGAVFAPSLTQQYAEGKIDEMRDALLQSVRIMGFIATLPTVCLYSFGLEFYTLWLPTQNAQELYVLTILGTCGTIFSMPQEGLWSIFTVTNKIKYTSIFLLIQNVVSFSLILFVIPFVEGLFMKLCVFSIVRSVVAIAKNLLFLPLFGAKCLNLSYKTFYPPVIKSFLSFCVAFSFAYSLHLVITADSWITLTVALVCAVVIALIVNSVVILRKSDRLYILSKIIKK